MLHVRVLAGRQRPLQPIGLFVLDADPRNVFMSTSSGQPVDPADVQQCQDALGFPVAAVVFKALSPVDIFYWSVSTPPASLAMTTSQNLTEVPVRGKR